MTTQYLDMMAESLDRKIGILQEMERLNTEQKEMFEQGEAMDDDAFNASVERKGDLIDELEKLDDGFDSLFAKVKEEIGDRKELYAEQIRAMQERIRTITDLSNTLQTQEARNKQVAEHYFAEARRRLGKGRQSSRTAMAYYSTMNKTQNIQPQFYDSKK